MKFICNNCGFSAKVPEAMNACPMCASQNVSFEEESTEDKGRAPKDTGNFTPTNAETPEQTPNEKINVKKKSPAQKKTAEKITLNDQFFDSKPNKEHEELANIIKELYPETTVKKEGFKFPPNFILTGGVAGAVIIVAVIVFVVFSSDKKTQDEKNSVAAVVDKDEEETEKKTLREIELEQSRKTETVVKEEEEEDLIETEEDVKAFAREKETPLKKEEVQQKRVPVKPRERVAQQQQAPVQKKVEKAAPVKAAPVVNTPPKQNTMEIYNSHLQAGHKAISERSFSLALNEYRAAAKIRPSDGTVYKFIGITYAHMQNQKEACANYRRYVQLSPNAKDRAQVEALIEACP